MPANLKLWITIGVLFLLFVLGLHFLIFVEKKNKRRRRVKPIKPTEQKDWKQASLKLERHVQLVRRENLDWQKRVKVLEREVVIYKQKNADLGEKLKRERVWQKKEVQDQKNCHKRAHQLENDMRTLEQNLEKEHLELVALRRKDTDTQEIVENQEHQVRYLQGEVGKITARADSYRKEILELRSENKKLAQKHEDVQWIAKSIHMKVKEELRQVKKELDCLKGQEKEE